MGRGEQHCERGGQVAQRSPGLLDGASGRLAGVSGEHQGSGRLHQPRLPARYHRLVLPFSAVTRTANLTRMAEDRFDVLVIGGGITGAGIALDAAARGLSVALVEKDDFASGTSGRSSRLVHGGLRYLEQREFGLVRESLRERAIMFRLAPHLVRPVAMYMLADDLRHRARYGVGLAGYDLLAAGRNVGIHRSASAERVRQAIPGLAAPSRGYRYFEGQTDDARLTIEVARTAHGFGAVLANHTRVEALLGGNRVTGAIAADALTGQRFEIRARITVNAGGVWADRIRGLAAAGRDRLIPSKGVHLVFAPGAIRAKVALVIESAAGDGRFVFLVPWEDRFYAGTTDTAYSGDLDHPAVADSDRDYILAAVARSFPEVTGRDVVASWAGLRPLLSEDETGADAEDVRPVAQARGLRRPARPVHHYRGQADHLPGHVRRPGGPGRRRAGGERAVPDAEHPARAARLGAGGGAPGHRGGGPPGPAAEGGRPPRRALRRRLAGSRPPHRT